jgi:hypothetical protein
MVDPKQSSRGTKGSLHPITAAALAALPPLGYKAPPTLIGFKTIDPSVIALRIKYYKAAYKNLPVNSWNTYVSFGIQDFASLAEYYTHTATVSTDEENLRLARYYRNHLENHAKIDGFLLQTIPAVETALMHSHPGFFDMSLKDMESYLLGLKQSADQGTSTMDIDTNYHNVTAMSALNAADAAAKPSRDENASHLPSPIPLTTQKEVLLLNSPEMLPITQEVKQSHPLAPPTRKSSSIKQSLEERHSSKPLTISGVEETPNLSTPPPPLTNARRQKTIKHVVRVETRWAPKDFNELRSSSEKMYRCLAPILSCFNSAHSWMIEWQTDQMGESPDIDPAQLSKFLSICVVPVAKESCFYFSFRICATGAQFSQVVTSKVLAIAKRGKNLTFDPSSIPSSQGKLTYVGDILLKDAAVTHRGQY